MAQIETLSQVVKVSFSLEFAGKLQAPQWIVLIAILEVIQSWDNMKLGKEDGSSTRKSSAKKNWHPDLPVPRFNIFRG